jgi:calcineurin-like phosphoesterase family protein
MTWFHLAIDLRRPGVYTIFHTDTYQADTSKTPPRPGQVLVMQTFFTADTHFDDEFAIPYFNRSFQSMDEMNAVLVERWNQVVTADDIVYHVGDFTTGDLSHFTKWANQLNGSIRIVPGNMDRLWLQDFVASEKAQVMPPLISLAFEQAGRVGQPQVIVLCHYSLQVWERSNHGSWHLFGHTHGKLKGIGRSFDVGVDCTDFVPLSLDQVAEKMAHG